MSKKRRPKSDVGPRLGRLPIRYSQNEDWYQMLEELGTKQNIAKASLIRKAVKHYYTLVTKSWVDAHHEIVEESRKKYIEGLKANGYDIQDVTDIFVPRKKEGYIYLIRKLGTSDLKLIMPPPFLGYGSLSLKTKEIQLVPDVVSEKDARDTTPTIVEKIRDYEKIHRGSLRISLSFPEYITDLVRYVTTHSTWSEAIFGPIPPHENVRKQKTVFFRDKDKTKTLAQDVARDFERFAASPPKNLQADFLWYEEPENWTNIVGLVLFFPAALRPKLSHMFNKEREKVNSKVVQPLKEWLDGLKSEGNPSFSFKLSF